MSKENNTDENGKRIRYDKFGNEITTKIGTFSVANRKNLIKKKQLSSSQSDTGGAESSPLKTTFLKSSSKLPSMP